MWTFSDPEVTQTDLGRQSKSCTDDIGATIILAANEPSQALFRIQVNTSLYKNSFD